MNKNKESIKSLLIFLFPKLKKVFRNVNYGSEWEVKWSEKQRISFPPYFQRYFSYTINKRDISDIAITKLLESSKIYSIDVIIGEIKEIFTNENLATLVSKLRYLSKKFTVYDRKC